MIYEYIKEEIKSNCVGTEVLESNLIDKDMLIRMGILQEWGPNIFMYNYMVKGGEIHSAILFCPEYFDRLTDNGLPRRYLPLGRECQHNRWSR